MADLDLQSLGMRLGEAITPTPSNAPQVRYGTIASVNANGTLDVEIDGTTLRGVCATTGCVGAAEGMRCVVLRQGPLATVVGLIAGTDLGSVYLQGDLNLENSRNHTSTVSGKMTDGVYRTMLHVYDDTTHVGYGDYSAQVGATHIWGNSIIFTSRSTIIANQRFVEKAALPVLWSGASWPTDTQTCNLSETVSSQSHGIILVWSLYNPSTGSVVGADWVYTVVAKDHAKANGVDVPLMSGSYNGWKYVYVHDDKITGYASNSSSSTTVGNMQRTNNRWVLRRVLGF